MRHPLEAIRASAGSGKTYALTTRYLSLLQGGHAPDGILATTFTRKAAGEILGRVLRRLAEAAEDEGKSGVLARDLEDESLQRGEFRVQLVQLCRSLHRVSISTLDSFFSQLSNSFRHELGTPAEASLLEGDSPQAVRLRLEAIRAVLAEDVTENWIALLDQLQHGTTQRSVTASLDELLSGLYEVYRQAPTEAWYRLTEPDGPGEAETGAAIGALRALGEALPDARMTKALLEDLERAQAQDWIPFLKKGLAPKVIEELPYYKKPIPPEIAALYRVLIAGARAELIGGIARQTVATHHLLTEFDRHYTELRRRRRALLFSDVPLALSRVLPDRTLEEIAYRIDTRVEHLLLDEFQDTSPEQWAILLPFARQIADSVSERATLFCVGDGKQAIYGWRGGCAEIFQQLDTDLAGLSWRSTEISYRSSPRVLEAVNRVFGTLTSNPTLSGDPADAEYWQERYGEHTAALSGRPGYVELSTTRVAGPDDDEEDDLPGHLQAAAERIAALAAGHPLASMGVLTRTNRGVRQLLFHLQRLGVAASGEGGSPVDDDPAVEAVLGALTLADHPGDTAAAYQVRTSPLGRFLGLEADDPDSTSIAARQVRAELLAAGYAATVARWASAIAPDCDRRGAQRLTQLIELADTYDPQCGLRPSDFVRYVRATAVEEPAPARVRVMSVHRSKGLEFDLVVLPELHGKMVSHRPALLVDRPAPTAPIRAVYRYASEEVRKLEPALAEAYRRQRSGEVREALCLLYVAMTRARYALHLIVPALGTTSKGAPKAPGFSHAAILRSALGEREEDPLGGEILYRNGNPNWISALPPAPAAGDSPPPGPIRLAVSSRERNGKVIRPSELEAGGRVDVSRLLALREPEPVRLGTLLHAWLERVRWTDDPPPDEAELVRLGLRAVDGADEVWCRSALPSFRAVLESEAVRVAIAYPDWPHAVELWQERPFGVRGREGLIRGTFDRVVVLRDAAGRPVQADLIDFKTDDVSLVGIPALAEVYRPQLLAYREALCRLLGLAEDSVRSRLLFVRPGIAFEVRPD